MSSTLSHCSTSDETSPKAVRGDGPRRPAEGENDHADAGKRRDVALADHHPCEHCETQLAEFATRLANIERQLRQMTTAVPEESLELSDPTAPHRDSTAGDAPADAIGPAPGGLPLAELTEDAAYRARPLDSRGREAEGSSGQVHRASDLPSWAEEYQSDEVDQSVKACVERLLQRVGNVGDRPNGVEAGVSSAEPRVEDAPTAVEESSIVATIGSEDRERPIALPVPAEPAGSPVERHVPRRAAAAELNGLSDMRQVANLSARTAIRAFEKNRAANHAIHRVPLMLVGLVCGAFLLFLATRGESGDVQTVLYAGAAVSLFAGSAAGWQAVSVLCRWMFADRSTKFRNHEMPS